MHAANIARHSRTTLSMVYDIDASAAKEVAQKEGARVGRFAWKRSSARPTSTRC